LYIHFPKILGPSPNFLITPKKNVRKNPKIAKKWGGKGTARSLSD
jgi:hypothetical protein